VVSRLSAKNDNLTGMKPLQWAGQQFKVDINNQLNRGPFAGKTQEHDVSFVLREALSYLQQSFTHSKGAFKR